MNERIRELAEQAGITFKPMVIDGIEYEYRHVNINDNKAEDEAGCIEQLVELIVMKCAEIGEQYADGNTDVYNNIVEYFGMQEPEE